MQKNISFLKAHIILLIIICLATFLRIFQIDRYAIMFPDAGHDLLAAHQYYQKGELPLLGITSSRPWLRQGPISLWIEMTGMALFGTSTYAQSMIFALFGVAALIALYELTVIYSDKKTAYFSVALLAVFPLAIAHSRMPYHTTPIPFATAIYLFSLMMLWQKNTSKNLFLALLAFAFLFQFELSNAPFIFLIPYLFWRKKYQVKAKIIFVGVSALLLGLLPQIIAALTGNSNQIMGFSAWIITQIKEVFTTSNGSSLIDKSAKTLSAFWLYGGRIFSVDLLLLKIIGFTGLATSIYRAGILFRQKKLPPLIELSVLATLLLVVGYWLAGPPSEAYFPPFFILFAILLGFGLTQLPKKILPANVIGLIIFMIINTASTIKNNYFVENTSSFQYEGVQEHREIARFLHTFSLEQPYRLATYEEIEIDIPVFFDHIRWLALEEDLQQPNVTGPLYLIEGKDVSPPNLTLKLQTFHAKVLYKVPNDN